VIQRRQAAAPPAAAAGHTLSLALPVAGVQVTAAYGTDQALVRPTRS
jgi:hypothetical protein